MSGKDFGCEFPPFKQSKIAREVRFRGGHLLDAHATSRAQRLRTRRYCKFQTCDQKVSLMLHRHLLLRTRSGGPSGATGGTLAACTLAVLGEAAALGHLAYLLQTSEAR